MRTFIFTRLHSWDGHVQRVNLPVFACSAYYDAHVSLRRLVERGLQKSPSSRRIDGHRDESLALVIADCTHACVVIGGLFGHRIRIRSHEIVNMNLVYIIYNQTVLSSAMLQRGGVRFS